MTDRTVSVALRMKVRDYITGGQQAIGTTRELQAAQRALGNESTVLSGKLTGVAGATDKLGDSTERAGKKMGRGALYGVAGIAALGVAGGGLKTLPPLLAAAATGAAALPGVLGGAAASAIVMTAATKNLGAALDEVNKVDDPFAVLAPNARAFVAAYAAAKPALHGIQQGLQDRVFRGTAADLNLMATQALPQVSGGLNKIADDWADLFAEIALTASSPAVIGAFNAVTTSADRFFDQINDRVRPIGQSIATLVNSADPVARAFGDELVGMIDRFNAAVERARQSGSLAELFAGGAQAAHELMSISTDILRITGMVISEASKSNSATADASQSLRAYVASGRAAGDVAGIVHTLTVAWEGLRDVLAPLGELVRDALADPATAASVQQLFSALAAGSQVLATVLSFLLELNTVSGGLLLALVGLAFAASKLTGALGLASAAAARGAASLTAYGAAGAFASKGIGVLAGSVGKLVAALFVLEAAHQVYAAFSNDAANVDALDAAVVRLAESGQLAGEASRVFNKGWADIGAQADLASADNFFANFLRGAEEAIPLTGDLARLLGSPSFVQSADNFTALDASISKYATTTGDLEGTTRAWNKALEDTGLDAADLAKLLPGTWEELGRMQTEAHGAAGGVQALAARTALLKAPIDEAVTAGRGLLALFTELNGGAIGFGRAQLAAEGAVDKLREGLDKNGLALNRTKDGFNILNEKGAANQAMLLDTAESAAKAAEARKIEGGTIEQAAAVYDQYINRARVALALQGATPAQIDAIIGKYTEMPASIGAAADSVNNLNNRLATIPKGTKFTFDGEQMVDGEGKALDLGEKLKGLPKNSTFTWNGRNLVDSTGKVVDLQAAIQGIPGSKATRITTPGIDPATGKVKGLAEELQTMPDGLANIQVNNGSALAAIRQVRQSMANLSGASIGIGNAAGGVYVPRQRGGLRKAAEGLLEPEIAPPGTRYQWAEPETGGELFLPRRGINRKRGRDLLGVAARWYDMGVYPMAAGGVRAAASGLVNVAPREVAPAPTRASRLDYAESYLRARDAVKALSGSLKENGRSFAYATTKGRENRSAVFDSIRAAQEAAKTRYEETGSIRLANKAYDEHIARLRRTLAQQKINASTIRSLLALGGRPTYDVPDKPVKAPTNSQGNVAFARALISATDGRTDLADKLSLNRPGASFGTDYGRENLGAVLDFLGQAEQVAQTRYAQTKNAKLAMTNYNRQIDDLRRILVAAGYASGTITSLINTYGRITLTPNVHGGAYMAAGGLATLDRAQMFASTGRPMYGFAEPGTGGELFVPRNGDRQRGRDLLAVGAGWYGSKLVSAGGASAPASYDYSTHMTVHARTYDPSPAELIEHQRTVEAHARSGRRY